MDTLPSPGLWDSLGYAATPPCRFLAGHSTTAPAATATDPAHRQSAQINSAILWLLSGEASYAIGRFIDQTGGR